ncbi:hypothetical protein N7454_010549 [Penicillium verhagenii]|nr:hypothetical protein N7454_010549 [Penicillium verhagenii]
MPDDIDSHPVWAAGIVASHLDQPFLSAGPIYSEIQSEYPTQSHRRLFGNPLVDYIAKYILQQSAFAILERPAVVNNTALPDKYGYKNYASNHTYNVDDNFSVLAFNSTPVEGLHHYCYNSVTPFSQKSIENDAHDAIRTLQKITAATSQPEP